ncbi:MAG: relaxase domain-containing protein, partial [Alphaproteobacteria bacterium]|nr:relaxase domain-containing protein [Alphaproteobacteria bacterium]
MVARVRNLTSSSSTAEYFHEEGGYYVTARGDREAARAKAEEHRQASAWHGRAAAALGLEQGRKVAAGAFERILQGHVPGTDIRLGRKREGKHEHRPGFDITFSAPKSVSLAALLPTAKHPRGDRAVLRCHDEAVRAALDWIEET